MLTIKDLIRRAREEIEAAVQERISNNESPLLIVESVTIEVNVVATEKKEGSGGFDLHVVTGGGAKSIEKQEVQKITVALRTPTPEDIKGGVLGMGAAAAGTESPQGFRPSGPAAIPVDKR